MSAEQLVAVDFETNEVGFFDRRKRKKIGWADHPRLARAIIVSAKFSESSSVNEEPGAFKKPDDAVLIFHNATFDIQVGSTIGIWNESEFR